MLGYRVRHSIRKTAAIFGVSVSTIQGWEKLQRETGKLDKKPLERKWRKVDPEKLRAHVGSHPDEFLEEIALAFECSAEAIRLALKKHGITRKKNDKVQRTQRS